MKVFLLDILVHICSYFYIDRKFTYHEDEICNPDSLYSDGVNIARTVAKSKLYVIAGHFSIIINYFPLKSIVFNRDSFFLAY